MSVSPRTTDQVFQDHLRLREQHDIDEDLGRNYASDVVLLTLDGVFKGHEGVRKTSSTLHHALPDAHYEYRVKLVAGSFAYLEWSAQVKGGQVQHAADSYVVHEGRIVAQTIHYYVQGQDGS